MRLSTSTRIAPMLIQTEFFGLGRRFSSSVPPFWRYRAGPSPAGEDVSRYATSADFTLADLRGGLTEGDSPVSIWTVLRRRIDAHAHRGRSG